MAISAPGAACREIGGVADQTDVAVFCDIASGTTVTATNRAELVVFALEDCRRFLAERPGFVRVLMKRLLLQRAVTRRGAVLLFSAGLSRELHRLTGQLYDRMEQYRAAEREARHLATHDTLTGLANRLKLYETIEVLTARARRSGGRFAVLYLDLDGFKAVNDEHGHQAGDAVLRMMAERLTGCVREVDTVARLGGDEFAILQDLGACADAEAIALGLGILAERVVAAVSEPATWEGAPLSLGASVGIAIYPGDGETADILLGHADNAMYEAKRAGKSGYRFFAAGIGRDVADKATQRADLSGALERGELTLRYQPRLRVATGRIEGIEALLRWDHPIRGPMAPADFLPLADRSGLIVPIGRWVMREACRRAKALQEAHGLDLPVSVNVSAAQLRQDDVLGLVRATLAESGLPAALLEVEVRETALSLIDAECPTLLPSLRALGVRVAVDDFGTGASSLKLLRSSLAGTVKIDPSLVSGAATDAKDRALLEAIIDLSRGLGIAAVAEGVANRGHLDLVRDAGCPMAQGYCLARPLEPDDLTRFIGLNRGSARAIEAVPAGASPEESLFQAECLVRLPAEELACPPSG